MHIDSYELKITGIVSITAPLLPDKKIGSMLICVGKINSAFMIGKVFKNTLKGLKNVAWGSAPGCRNGFYNIPRQYITSTVHTLSRDDDQDLMRDIRSLIELKRVTIGTNYVPLITFHIDGFWVISFTWGAAPGCDT